MLRWRLSFMTRLRPSPHQIMARSSFRTLSVARLYKKYAIFNDRANYSRVIIYGLQVSTQCENAFRILLHQVRDAYRADKLSIFQYFPRISDWTLLRQSNDCVAMSRICKVRNSDLFKTPGRAHSVLHWARNHSEFLQR